MTEFFSYYVYLKTDNEHVVFEPGITCNILQTLTEKRATFCVAESSLTNNYRICSKLVYYEYGHDKISAQQRCEKIKKLPPSKRNALIERSNPGWRDLSIFWLR